MSIFCHIREGLTGRLVCFFVKRPRPTLAQSCGGGLVMVVDVILFVVVGGERVVVGVMYRSTGVAVVAVRGNL